MGGPTYDASCYSFTLPEVLSQQEELFKEELGELKGPPAKIYVDKEAVSRFFKA